MLHEKIFLYVTKAVAPCGAVGSVVQLSIGSRAGTWVSCVETHPHPAPDTGTTRASCHACSWGTYLAKMDVCT